jgi:YfiH family protein
VSSSDAVRSWFEADWPAPPTVRALSTVRGADGAGVSQGPFAYFNLGSDVGDDPLAVAENRRRLRSLAGLPAEPNWLKQVHGVTVADLDAVKPGDVVGPREAADAAITRSPGRVCAILTADCMPVVFATASGDGVAAAHAGWRGLSAGVIRATVEALGGAPERLFAWLGPAIGPKHFEVGAEVREAFLDQDPGAETAFQLNARGRFMADLAELARRQLKKLGVTRIYGGTECTFDRPDRYFSYRRDGVTGRQATLIWREA